MSVAQESLADIPDIRQLLEPEGTVLLHHIPWHIYQALRDDDNYRNLRMTYDRGELEIMSPQKKHGKVATLLGLMIYEWTCHRCVELESGGNLTCRRQDLLKGLEPDLCYWIASQPEVHGRDGWDILADPPPDLALEVDATRSSLPKLPIYAALKIPEVWRWRKGIEVLRLESNGQYVQVAESMALPGFPIELAEAFIERRTMAGENALMKQFVAAIAALPGS